VYQFAQCVRCGYRWEITAKRNNLLAKCASCKTIKRERIEYDDETCLAWQGDFDREDNPIMNGVLYLPGFRICQHRDCCNVNHIVPFERNE
jgi:hypothetical protein